MEVNPNFLALPNLISLGMLLIPLSIYFGFISGCSNCLSWLFFWCFELAILAFCHSHFRFPTFLPNLFHQRAPSLKETTTPISSPTDSAIVVTNPSVSPLVPPSLASLNPMSMTTAISSSPSHRFEKECKQLTDKFTALIQSNQHDPNNSGWELIVDRGSHVKIWRHTTNEHRYKILGLFEASLVPTFDFLNDIENRPNWDEMAETTRILESLSPSARIQYIRVKAIWPTSARDLVLLSHWKQVDMHRWIACTTSIEHSAMPVQPGVVRMQVDCAGQLCEKTMHQGTEHTRVLQIVDGNPGGWIPKSVLTMVATKTLPDSFLRVQSLVKALPPATTSKFFGPTSFINGLTDKYAYTLGTPPPHEPLPSATPMPLLEDKEDAGAVSKNQTPPTDSSFTHAVDVFAYLPFSPTLRPYLKYSSPILLTVLITMLVFKRRRIPFQAIAMAVLSKLAEKVARVF